MDKSELVFRKPLMNAAGMLGYAPDVHAGLNSFPNGNWEDLGAFVTNPLSLRPRQPASAPGVLEFAGGALLHTGLPNPGFWGALKKYARRWAVTALPVIVHLMADGLDETAGMVRALEGLENIAAIELGFAPQQAADFILRLVEVARGELPLIANLPFEQALSLGPRVIKGGAAALSFAPPHGVLPGTAGPEPLLISGRLYGPALFPQALNLLSGLVRLGVPVIGGVGVFGPEQARTMLGCGALAVQLDTLLWQ